MFFHFQFILEPILSMIKQIHPKSIFGIIRGRLGGGAENLTSGMLHLVG